MKIIITELQFKRVVNNILNEEKILKVPKPNKSFLYHGSNIKNLDSIKRFGLLPDFGDTVKNTESYQMYMDDEYYDQNEDRVEGVLFFSDNPDTWSYSNFGGTPNINEAILVIIKKNETIFRRINGYVYDMKNKKVNTVNYIDVESLPNFIENGDYFSLEEQEPYDILYGERLVKYLEQFN
jgi:hypothetical protein